MLDYLICILLKLLKDFFRSKSAVKELNKSAHVTTENKTTAFRFANKEGMFSSLRAILL